METSEFRSFASKNKVIVTRDLKECMDNCVGKHEGNPEEQSSCCYKCLNDQEQSDQESTSTISVSSTSESEHVHEDSDESGNSQSSMSEEELSTTDVGIATDYWEHRGKNQIVRKHLTPRRTFYKPVLEDNERLYLPIPNAPRNIRIEFHDKQGRVHERIVENALRFQTFDRSLKLRCTDVVKRNSFNLDAGVLIGTTIPCYLGMKSADLSSQRRTNVTYTNGTTNEINDDWRARVKGKQLDSWTGETIF